MNKVDGQGAAEGDYKKSDSESIDQLIDIIKGFGKTEAPTSSEKLAGDLVTSATGSSTAAGKMIPSDTKPEVPQIPMPLHVESSDGMDGVRGNPWLKNQYAILAIILREWSREQMKTKFELGEYRAEHTTAMGQATQMRAQSTLEIGRQEFIKGILNATISGITAIVSFTSAAKTTRVEEYARIKYDEKTARMQDNTLYSEKKDNALVVRSELDTKFQKTAQKQFTLQQGSPQYIKNQEKLDRLRGKIEKVDGVITAIDSKYRNKTELERLELAREAMERDGLGVDTNPNYVNNTRQIADVKLNIKNAENTIDTFGFRNNAYREYETNKEKLEKEQKNSLSLQDQIDAKRQRPDLSKAEKTLLDTGQHPLDKNLAKSRARAEKYREKMEKYEPGSKNLEEMLEDLENTGKKETELDKYNAIKNKKVEVDTALTSREGELRTKTIGDETTREYQYLNMLTQGANQILNAIKELGSGAIENLKMMIEARKQLEEALVSIATQGRDAVDEHRKQFSDDLSENIRSLHQLFAGQTKIGDISNR